MVVVGGGAAGLSGALAAGAMINMDLIEEETAAAVEDVPKEVGMSHDHEHEQNHGGHGEITREHFEQSSWDERYAGDGRTWSGRPNAVLVAEASDLAPGRAVDLGCGEGGDAIWLAERGWQVTAIDFSEAGLRKAAEHAAERGVADRIEFRQADLRTWTPEGEQWDLVTSCFLHLLDDGMLEATRQMAEAVAPGGTLLVAGHHPDDEHTGLRWSMPGVHVHRGRAGAGGRRRAVRRTRRGARAHRDPPRRDPLGHRRGAGSGQELTAFGRTVGP